MQIFQKLSRTMSNHTKKVSKFFDLKPVDLGRWKLNYDNNSVYKKSDWGNHDHCGPCDYVEYKDIETTQNTNVTNHKYVETRA